MLAPAGRRLQKRKKKSKAETRRKKIIRKRPALSGTRNRSPVGFLFCKFARFSILSKALLRPRKIAPIENPKEGRKQMNLDITFFWREPDAKFCTICGDEEEKHLEPICPYNYLSPSTYAPCRPWLLLWGSGMSAFDCRLSHEREVPRQDEISQRRLRFLRCFVRVNNLPERCCPEELVNLFKRFGPLWMWHVALHNSGARRGIGYIIFRHREHAEEAMDALNCYNFHNCKLRVDWAYPSA